MSATDTAKQRQQLQQQQLQQLQQQQLQQSINSYWDLRASGYSADIVSEMQDDHKGTLAQLDLLISQYTPELNAQASAQAQAVDLGCGPALLTMHLAKQGFVVTAIDQSEQMRKQAAHNCTQFLSAKQQERVHIVAGDVMAPPLAAKSVDLIVARDVFWNLPDPLQAYKSALAALKDDGLLVIFDGNYYYGFQNAAYQKDYSQTHKHLEGVDVSQIEKLARVLPLSYHLRPQYDLELLRSLTQFKVEPHASIAHKSTDPTTNKEVISWEDLEQHEAKHPHALIENFVLCVKKISAV